MARLLQQLAGPLILAFAPIAPGIAQAISLDAVTITTPDGPARGLVATVRLDDPRLEVLVTGPLSPAEASACGDRAEAIGRRVDAWASKTGALLAVNANYFGTLGEGGCQDIIGLSIAGGVVVSPPRRYGESWDPAVCFSDGRATIGRLSESDASGALAAVAGVGASDSAPDLGGLLVTDGANTGRTARVEPLVRHPRTAVGVSADGSTLVIAAIDGRQPEWSVGLTLPELADLLITRGVDDAVNLDGGGSTSLVCVAGETRITNRPSDGEFRGVANHLGFAMRPEFDVTGAGKGAQAPFVLLSGGMEAFEGFLTEEFER